MRAGWIGCMMALAMFGVAGCGGGSPSAPTTVSPGATTSTTTTTTTTTTTPGTGGTGPGTVTVAYTQDIKPILDADCTRCHGSRTKDAGVDLSTYASTMRVVQAGSASSLLVRVTQSGGLMYSQLSGDRAAKSSLIRQWVVDNNAAESR